MKVAQIFPESCTIFFHKLYLSILKIGRFCGKVALFSQAAENQSEKILFRKCNDFLKTTKEFKEKAKYEVKCVFLVES